MYNHPYRGYKKSRNRLLRLTLLIFIVFALLIGVLGYLFVQNYLVFSSSGVKVALPFNQSAKGTTEPAKEPDLEILDPKAAAASDTPSAVTNTQPSATTATGLRTVYIPVEKLSDTAYLNQLIALRQKGVLNSVTVDIKTDAGMLNYVTAIDSVKDLGLSSDAASYFKNGIATLKAAGLQVIGKISCFDDNTMPKKQKDMAVKTKKGLTWLDNNSKRHLNPYSDKAAQYLSGIVKESSEMGFSEVILTNFTFPDKGQLKLISFGEQALNKSEILSKRLTEFTQAAGAMKVSVYLDQPMAANGKNETTGMDIASLYQTAYRVYAPLEGQSAEGETAMVNAVSTASGGDKSKIVPVFSRMDYFTKVMTQSVASSNYYFDLVENNYSLDNLGV